MTEELLLRGLSDYIGEGISVANEQARAARERGEKVPYNRFTTMLKRWAKDKGADIGKFFK